MATYFWIGLGSALGGMARYWCSGAAARMLGETFPWGTLFVNILGSFIIGLFAALTGPDGRMFADTHTRQFVMIGLCGGYTTFSSFSLQTLALMQDGEWGLAGANIVAGSFVVAEEFGRDPGRPDLGGQTVDFRQVQVGGGLRYHFRQKLAFELSGGWTLDQRYDFYDRGLDFEGSGTPYVQIGFGLTF